MQRCPFCGSVALHVGLITNLEFGVLCLTCNACIVEPLPKATPLSIEALQETQKIALDKAIAKWNRRNCPEWNPIV